MLHDATFVEAGKASLTSLQCPSRGTGQVASQTGAQVFSEYKTGRYRWQRKEQLHEHETSNEQGATLNSQKAIDKRELRVDKNAPRTRGQAMLCRHATPQLHRMLAFGTYPDLFCLSLRNLCRDLAGSLSSICCCESSGRAGPRLGFWSAKLFFGVHRTPTTRVLLSVVPPLSTKHKRASEKRKKKHRTNPKQGDPPRIIAEEHYLWVEGARLAGLSLMSLITT